MARVSGMVRRYSSTFLVNGKGEESMRAVVQRVTEASVTVDGKIVGAIEKGFMVVPLRACVQVLQHLEL